MATNGELVSPRPNGGQTTEQRRPTSMDYCGNVNINTDGSNLEAQVTRDGRVDIRFSEQALKLSKHFHMPARWSTPKQDGEFSPVRDYEATFHELLQKYSAVPRLNIAIHIVGSRGDVQPFIAIGQCLMAPPCGHRVRICTHPVFKDFVEENGLEFFSIGGDPNSLMAYMVKNPGLLPGKDSWKSGEVGKRRAEFAVILDGCWRSCIEPGNGMGEETQTPQSTEGRTLREDNERHFIADAIIANPPSYGHIHCAEKLGIPLHMMFTMPWSPTQYFPHPLASLQGHKSDPRYANYMSYTIMELLAWQGLGDVINGFRMRTLHLDAISPLWGHMLLSQLKVPFTYTWSSALIPKPADWGPHINITGFSFLKAGSNYHPPEDLVQFLKAGPPPVYIGFGSIVVDKPEELTKTIFGAVKRAGVRALVSKGWGGLGDGDVPKDIFLLGNCPHDWLFQYVSCVVHHGGAGTSAIGIAMGKPTIVVPFFGDQPFWGAMIYRANAGPEPVPYKDLTAENLAESIKKALQPGIKASVHEMSDKIAGENGAEDAAASFNNAVGYDSMRCMLCPEKIAVWRVKKTNLRLSSLAVTVLTDNGILSLRDVTLLRHRDWYIDQGPAGPITAVIASVSDTVVKTWVSTSTYTKRLSTTIHRKPVPKDSPRPSQERRASPPVRGILAGDNPVNPVQEALTYPPEHLEWLAYSMASERLPDVKNRSVHRKMHTWSPRLQMTSVLKPSPSYKHEPEQPHSKAHEITDETGEFAYSVMRTGFHAPVAFFYNLANGFHNAPNFILNDNTVRRRDKIRGFESGVEVAATGFVLNLYDGFTGIVTHPYRDAKKDGVVGFSKGVGRGVGGLVLKTMAAVTGLPGYTLKGIEKQLEKRSDRDLKAQILKVRLHIGLSEFKNTTPEEREAILKRWREFNTR